MVAILYRLAGIVLILPACAWTVAWVCLATVCALPGIIIFGLDRTANFFISDIVFFPVEFAWRLVTAQ